jgi:hypothetical protein
MSRARPINLPDGTQIWFDQNLNGQKATSNQLAWLAAAEDTPIDSLLDEGLSQGQVLFRLRAVMEPGTIPFDIIERRRKAREEARRQPACRICFSLDLECDGDITRHHFVPRWMMLELENYSAYAARSKCTPGPPFRRRQRNAEVHCTVHDGRRAIFCSADARRA